ncbi:MAG: exosortase/archaeosortase family protein, partial [Proteobacteria bacterium]|nr:exosortase/archaeosortase family protein [Pseudomonadota bacterium]
SFDRRAWYLIVPISMLLLLNVYLIHSLSLTNYGFLCLVFGFCCLSLRGQALQRAASLLTAAAIMVYPPRIIFEAMTNWLLDLVFLVSARFSRILMPDLIFAHQSVSIGAKPILFINACSGSNFIMLILAVILIFLKQEKGNLFQLVLALFSGAILAFALNISRILLTLALAKSGYWDFAMSYGHEWIGQGFMCLGLMIILSMCVRSSSSKSCLSLSPPA